MNKITCPKCGTKYSVYKIEEKTIKCQDCGAEYHQGFNSEKMPLWIKSMSTKLSKTLDFWKGL